MIRIKSKKATKVELTPMVRNKLRMVCAFQGYSYLKQGKGETVMQQQDAMYAFYHGKESSRPSQIKTLWEGIYAYSDLYEKHQKVSTSKSDSVKTTTELR